MHINTLDSYLGALNRLFVLDELPAWSPGLRSKAAVRVSDTRHFSDPAIAAYFLQAFPNDLIQDMETLGLLFESLAVRDLRVYSQALRGHLSRYRDSTGHEIDSVVHLPGGQWAAVEIKMGVGKADEAAKSLLAFRDKVDTSHIRPSAFLMIVTAAEYAYTRADGIHVVPLGCLKS